LQVLKTGKKSRGRLFEEAKEERRTDSCRFPLTASAREGAHFLASGRFLRFQCVEQNKKLKEKLEYMHANPVQKKASWNTPKDWP